MDSSRGSNKSKINGAHSALSVLAAFVLSALVLGGCATHYVFEDFKGGYQAPEMPTVFAATQTGWNFSAHLAYNNQGPIRYQPEDSLWGDTASGRVYFNREHADAASLSRPGLLRGNYGIERSPLLAGISLFSVHKYGFYGFTGGVAAPSLTQVQFGAFAGYSQLLLSGRLAPMLALGVFMNRVEVSGRYWSEPEGLLTGSGDDPSYPAYQRSTAREAEIHWDIPVKLGVLYSMHPAFQPYLLAYGNTTSLWPDESDEPERFLVYDSGLALGIRNQSIPGWMLTFEVASLLIEGPMNHESEPVKIHFQMQRLF
jgi:hypothetical protein